VTVDEQERKRYAENSRGHTWVRDEGDEIHLYAFDIQGHAGPQCSTCGYEFCRFCQPLPTEDCTA